MIRYCRKGIVKRGWESFRVACDGVRGRIPPRRAQFEDRLGRSHRIEVIPSMLCGVTFPRFRGHPVKPQPSSPRTRPGNSSREWSDDVASDLPHFGVFAISAMTACRPGTTRAIRSYCANSGLSALRMVGGGDNCGDGASIDQRCFVVNRRSPGRPPMPGSCSDDREQGHDADEPGKTGPCPG